MPLTLTSEARVFNPKKCGVQGRSPDGGLVLLMATVLKYFLRNMPLTLTSEARVLNPMQGPGAQARWGAWGAKPFTNFF